MVEKLARAIASVRAGPISDEDWRQLKLGSPDYVEGACAAALAAMEALLEPSEEMVRAATDYIATNIDGGCSAHDAREVLRTALTRAMGK